MLVVETADRFRFVTQPAHADVAGRFAERWGANGFEAPIPQAATTAAAYTHDTGWLAYDRHPHLADGEPVDFRDMPPATWIDIYTTGIEAVVEMDAYAGLLVSLHGSGLRRRRYGLSPAWPATPSPFVDFVQREEERQAALAAELASADRLASADVSLVETLHETGTPAGADSRLWRNYERLEAWDALSLTICLSYEASEPTSVGPVPRGSERAQLSVRPVSGDTFELTPYPFDVDPLMVTVPTRTVPKTAFNDEASLVRAYYAAGRDERSCTIRSGESA